MQSPERHFSSWARECLIIWIWMPSVEPTAACRAVYGAVSGALSIDELGSARVELVGMSCSWAAMYVLPQVM